MITTVKSLNEQMPGLLRNSIDERIVKIRPMSTPIDQLSRCAGSRHAGSMTVKYYSVDTKAVETTLKGAVAGGVGDEMSEDMFVHVIRTNDDSIFEASETILVPDVLVDNSPLVLYCVSRSNSGLVVAPVNGPLDAKGRKMPAIPDGTRLVRMGRAASELDVQTAQFAVAPRSAENNCQIFKMQVEQSTLAKIADKEVGWSFSDQEEAAIIDMRLGMEKSFIFGAKAKLYNTEKSDYLYLTGGIWNQAGRDISLDIDKLTEGDLIDLCSAAFTGNNGSKRKILLVGTAMLEALSKIQLTRMVRGLETRVKWGVEFKELVSNFGTLYIVHSEIFDQCGHSSDGFILDPNYMTKYVHVPFQAEKLDLRRSGQRNTDAVVMSNIIE